MRLATVNTDRGQRLHVRKPAGYVDVAAALGDERFAALGNVLGDEAAFEAIRGLGDEGAVEVDDAELAAAVPSPRRILCLGLNYSEHALEGGRDVPTWPESFVRGPDSVLAPYGDLVRPALSEPNVAGTASSWANGLLPKMPRDSTSVRPAYQVPSCDVSP